ncbi:MAG: hypothetical protein MPW13_17200 [Candidatus Manganitrophus sp.]|nr:hypothetical protein [Candidatus Manganitrophus sp.]
MAGYLFQPERALYRLAHSPYGSLVGIETLDDISVLLADGKQIREQDKHSTSGKSPLADRSKNFWQSLKNCLRALDDEEIDLSNIEFHFVTNQRLTGGLAFELMCGVNTHESKIAFVRNLRKAGEKPPANIRDIVSEVLAREDQELVALIGRLRVYDGSSSTSGEKLRKQVAERLLLPEPHVETIIHGLMGWIHDTALDLIRQRKPAWLSQDAFANQYRSLLFLCQDQSFIRETEQALVIVGEEEQRAQWGKLFVKQLAWIGVPQDHEEMIDAINDYLRYGSEATRLTQAGVVHPADFRAFSERLIRHWKDIKRIHNPKPLPKNERALASLGRTVFNNVMNHREKLAGQETSEAYLTQGGYHRLADELRLGWHPNYEKKAQMLSKSKNSKI